MIILFGYIHIPLFVYLKILRNSEVSQCGVGFHKRWMIFFFARLPGNKNKLSENMFCRKSIEQNTAHTFQRESHVKPNQ